MTCGIVRPHPPFRIKSVIFTPHYALCVISHAIIVGLNECSHFLLLFRLSDDTTGWELGCSAVLAFRFTGFLFWRDCSYSPRPSDAIFGRMDDKQPLTVTLLDLCLLKAFAGHAPLYTAGHSPV